MKTIEDRLTISWYVSDTLIYRRQSKKPSSIISLPSLGYNPRYKRGGASAYSHPIMRRVLLV